MEHYGQIIKSFIVAYKFLLENYNKSITDMKQQLISLGIEEKNIFDAFLVPQIYGT